MASLSGKRITQKELNRISNFVWETVKRITPSFKEENDESNMKFFYVPPQSLSEPMSVSMEDRVMVDCGIRHSRILLKYHEMIVHQLTL
jgi:hypothetical protein